MGKLSLADWLRKNVPGLQDWVWRIRAKRWPDRSIVYFVEKPHDGLTPYSLQEGASGSHTAVIYLAKEWAKLGYQVTIYSKCDDREGIYDGVRYINYYHFNWYDTFDILLVWRHPYLLKPDVKARKIGLDWHDLLDPPRCFPPDIIARFDVVFSKSQFQRRLLPEFPDSKFTVVSNGINGEIASLYHCKKQPYRLVYASRYYRGLEEMLTHGWPIIKAAIPEAELHIYYGFNRVELGPELVGWRNKMVDLMSQPGVVNHSRVSQHELIEDKAKSSIHYYGCTFEEIDCISVRESAVVGCVPVTTDYAVFTEKEYCNKVPGNPKDPNTQVALAHRIVELLKDPEKLEQLRVTYAELAKQDTWDYIAQRWIDSLEKP